MGAVGRRGLGGLTGASDLRPRVERVGGICLAACERRRTGCAGVGVGRRGAGIGRGRAARAADLCVQDRRAHAERRDGAQVRARRDGRRLGIGGIVGAPPIGGAGRRGRCATCWSSVAACCCNCVSSGAWRGARMLNRRRRRRRHRGLAQSRRGGDDRRVVLREARSGTGCRASRAGRMKRLGVRTRRYRHDIHRAVPRPRLSITGDDNFTVVGGAACARRARRAVRRIPAGGFSITGYHDHAGRRLRPCAERQRRREQHGEQRRGPAGWARRTPRGPPRRADAQARRGLPHRAFRRNAAFAHIRSLRAPDHRGALVGFFHEVDSRTGPRAEKPELKAAFLLVRPIAACGAPLRCLSCGTPSIFPPAGRAQQSRQVCKGCRDGEPDDRQTR